MRRRPRFRGAPLLAVLASCQQSPPPPIAASAAPLIIPVPSAAPTAGPVRDRFLLEGAMAQGALLRGRVPTGTTSLALDGKPLPFAADGRFLLGFDRDQPAEAVLEARLGDRRAVRQNLRVAQRAWRIEHVDVAQRPAGSSAEYLRVRAGELGRIAAARAVAAQSEGWRQDFIRPATGRISGVFGSQRIYRGEPGAYHSGLDIAAGAGARVVAPADGVVVLAGSPMFSLEGNLIIIDHGMGLNSAFLHLARSDVREGQRVRQGEPIGTVGATGRATGPHLHWGVKWHGARIEPPLPAGE